MKTIFKKKLKIFIKQRLDGAKSQIPLNRGNELARILMKLDKKPGWTQIITDKIITDENIKEN